MLPLGLSNVWSYETVTFMVFAVSAVVKSAAVVRKSLMMAAVSGRAEPDGLEVVVRKKTSDAAEMPETLEGFIYQA